MKGAFVLGVLLCCLELSAAPQHQRLPCRKKEVRKVEQERGLPNVSAQIPSVHRLNLFTDLLIWNATQGGCEIWAQIDTTTGSSESIDILQVVFGWDPGFRVGLDYGMEYDQWDTKVYYTWFRSQANTHASSGAGSVLSSFMGNYFVGNESGTQITSAEYHNASLTWAILFNLFDWSLGRNYRVISTT